MTILLSNISTKSKKEKTIDKIITAAPEVQRGYHFTKDNRNTMIETASCDILAVIPVITFCDLRIHALGAHPVPAHSFDRYWVHILQLCKTYWQEKMGQRNILRNIYPGHHERDLFLRVVIIAANARCLTHQPNLFRRGQVVHECARGL